MLKGIDISNWQETLNIGASGADFVIVKATEGVGWLSRSYQHQAQATLAGGKLLGLYHFARPDLGNSAQAEAAYFVSQVKPYVRCAVLVLDWEPVGGQIGNVAWAKAWLDEVTRLTGVKPWLYASASPLKAYAWEPIAPDYGVWIAGYLNSRPNVLTDIQLPAGYQPGHGLTVAAYQYTSTGRVTGYAGDVDLNVFYGDTSAWNAYANPSGASTAPTVPQFAATPDELADAVMRGEYGNGEARVRALGANYAVVQAIVNQRLGAPVDLDTLADAVMRGEYGNGEARVRALGSIYPEVQARVNEKLGGR